MNYNLIKDIIDVAHDFEEATALDDRYTDSIEDFKAWCGTNYNNIKKKTEPNWEGKDYGRAPEAAISTLLVNMNRFAKMYSRAAIANSAFSTQEDFIYLINLRAHGEMTKTALLRKNLHDKPTGMQIITRLMSRGWIQQVNSITDKRSKVISITDKGIAALELQMPKIRTATNIVSGILSLDDKMELIRILTKLEDFHRPIFNSNITPSELLSQINNDLPTS